MSRRGLRAVAALVAAAVTGATLGGAPLRPLAAQEAPGTAAIVSRALEHESAGRNREAIDSWRAALASGVVIPAALGLERVFSLLAQEDSLLVMFDTLVPRYPRELQLRAAQLRTLITLGMNTQAQVEFGKWRALAPTDVAPYREYARVLLFNNRAAAADTVLRLATETLGSTRALVLETAQMRSALGLWKDAAESWREAMRDEPYYESAAVFSLSPTPRDLRDLVRRELGVPGTPLGALQALALLEVQWGAPRDGWRVLSALPPSDTVVAIWRQFADEVQRVRAWAAARDALGAIHQARPDGATAVRAAAAALAADDPVAGLRLAREAAAALPDSIALADALPLELDALARLGRASEAVRVLAKARPALGAEGARPLARHIAWAWIRAGDVARAREALKDAPLAAEDAVSGWLALFDGDLDGARVALRNSENPGQDVISALSLLNRTRESRSAAIGQAFLALAKGDSVQAAQRFERAAADLADAAPLLLALAARIETARRDEERSLTLWKRVAAEHPESPEAAEADLEWARGLRRRGDIPGARERLEHLILTYPSSALVPQARRELDTLRVGAVS
ncbi:MAG: hypothetical protein KJZ74_07420 [Gemmatimonadales bacterium]|nr:hypothetical protein [Gemmatimonadales bacterium]